MTTTPRVSALQIRLNVAAAGLKNHNGELSPSSQRSVFGSVPFGRHGLRFGPAGVEAQHPVTGAITHHSYTEIAQLARQDPTPPSAQPRWLSRLHEAGR